MSYLLSLKAEFESVEEVLAALHILTGISTQAPDRLKLNVTQIGEIDEDAKTNLDVAMAKMLFKEFKPKPLTKACFTEENTEVSGKTSWICTECNEFPCEVTIHYNHPEDDPPSIDNCGCICDTTATPKWCKKSSKVKPTKEISEGESRRRHAEEELKRRGNYTEGHQIGEGQSVAKFEGCNSSTTWLCSVCRLPCTIIIEHNSEKDTFIRDDTPCVHFNTKVPTWKKQPKIKENKNLIVICKSCASPCTLSVEYVEHNEDPIFNKNLGCACGNQIPNWKIKSQP